MSHDPLISVDSVHKTYRLGKQRVPVLRGVSLNVAPGETVAIIGKSGSGKSTLLHLMGGLDRPRRDPADKGPSGEITFQGEPLSRMSAQRLDRYRVREVGFIFQFYHLLPELNVLENALAPRMVREGRFGFAKSRRQAFAEASELLATLGLADRLRHRPAELSGGERQRVAVARSLINHPALVLADEPTGNLDPTTGGLLLDQLAERQRSDSFALVMVTHDQRIARRADRVFRLTDGALEPNHQSDAHLQPADRAG